MAKTTKKSTKQNKLKQADKKGLTAHEARKRIEEIMEQRKFDELYDW